jgi:hypothetical protein
MYVVVAVIVLSMGAVVAALMMVLKNRRAQAALPVEEVRAEVLRTFTDVQQTGDNFTTQTVDSYNSWEQTRCFVEFKLPDGSRKTFQADKRPWAEWMEGSSGVLKFQGDVLKSFEAEEHQQRAPVAPARPFFMKETVQSGGLLSLYGHAPMVGVVIESHEAVEVDFEEVDVFLAGVEATSGEMFFVLEDEEGRVLQFARSGGEASLEAEVLAGPGGASRTALVAAPGTARELVWAFVNGQDPTAVQGFSFASA